MGSQWSFAYAVYALDTLDSAQRTAERREKGETPVRDGADNNVKAWLDGQIAAEGATKQERVISGQCMLHYYTSSRSAVANAGTRVARCATR